MKVVCICDNIARISIGKSYDVFSINMIRDTYLIINDDGYRSWYGKNVIIPLEEFREKRLKELGI